MLYTQLTHRRFLTFSMERLRRSCVCGRSVDLSMVHVPHRGTAVAQWLGCCARNRKVADSILDGIIVIFH